MQKQSSIMTKQTMQQLKNFIQNQILSNKMEQLPQQIESQNSHELLQKNKLLKQLAQLTLIMISEGQQLIQDKCRLTIKNDELILVIRDLQQQNYRLQQKNQLYLNKITQLESAIQQQTAELVKKSRQQIDVLEKVNIQNIELRQEIVYLKKQIKNQKVQNQLTRQASQKLIAAQIQNFRTRIKQNHHQKSIILNKSQLEQLQQQQIESISNLQISVQKMREESLQISSYKQSLEKDLYEFNLVRELSKQQNQVWDIEINSQSNTSRILQYNNFQYKKQNQSSLLNHGPIQIQTNVAQLKKYEQIKQNNQCKTPKLSRIKSLSRTLTNTTKQSTISRKNFNKKFKKEDVSNISKPSQTKKFTNKVLKKKAQVIQNTLQSKKSQKNLQYSQSESQIVFKHHRKL